MSLLPLTQDVTFWTAGASDVNGSPSFSAPVSIKARWARKDGIATDDKGDDQKTEFVIYATVLIPKRARVVLGVDVSATPPSGSRIVMSNVDNPSLTNLIQHKA